MNSLSSLIKQIKESFRGLISWLCNSGMFYPDDDHSGIVINGKAYTVVYTMGGKKMYIDEDGNLQSIHELDANNVKWEWKNINERHLKSTEHCFRTPGGEVKIISWWSVTEDVPDELSQEHYIINSSDKDNPVGKKLLEIPDTWTPMRCELADMEERTVVYVLYCFRTPGGKVEVEGFESRDPETVNRISSYTILRSTDPDIEPGERFSVKPTSWVRVTCDFPDMTQRLLQEVNSCFATPGGKVRVEGIVSLDPVLEAREEYYVVVETTDPIFSENTVIRDIPDDWTQMVCDFPDRTQRDTEIIERCYRYSSDGVATKVKVRSYLTYDYKGDVMEQVNIVLRSTDKSIIGNIIPDIPESWDEFECDFADLTQRHFIEVDDCYVTEKGEVRVKGHEFWNEEIGKTASKYIVIYTENPDVQNGSVLTSIPGSWIKKPCIQQIFLKNVHECYASESGRKFYVEGYRMLDGNMEEKSIKFTVIEVSDGNTDVSVGDIITSIPDGYRRVSCDCNCGGIQ